MKNDRVGYFRRCIEVNNAFGRCSNKLPKWQNISGILLANNSDFKFITTKIRNLTKYQRKEYPKTIPCIAKPNISCSKIFKN
jgi:hypothetical protein